MTTNTTPCPRCHTRPAGAHFLSGYGAVCDQCFARWHRPTVAFVRLRRDIAQTLEAHGYTVIGSSAEHPVRYRVARGCAVYLWTGEQCRAQALRLDGKAMAA